VEIVYYAFDHIEVEVNHDCPQGQIDPALVDFHFDTWLSDDLATTNYLLFLDIGGDKQAVATGPYRISCSFLVQIAFPQPELFAIESESEAKHRVLLEGATTAYLALQAAIATLTKGCLNGEILIPVPDLTTYIRTEG
jgi:hypothetical protein